MSIRYVLYDGSMADKPCRFLKIGAFLGPVVRFSVQSFTLEINLTLTTTPFFLPCRHWGVGFDSCQRSNKHFKNCHDKGRFSVIRRAKSRKGLIASGRTRHRHLFCQGSCWYLQLTWRESRCKKNNALCVCT